MSASRPHAFDPLAATYDEQFSFTQLGRALRERVWRHTDRLFLEGDRILDLGCGSGEDTLHLTRRGCFVDAVEPSSQMRELVERKVAAAGLASQVRVYSGHLGRVSETGREAGGVRGDVPMRRASTSASASASASASTSGFIAAARALGEIEALDLNYDGSMANFGVLNCVGSLERAALQIGGRLKPGAAFIASVMAPACLWEIAFYLRAGSPGRAFRRFKRGGVQADFGAGPIRVDYPSVRRLARVFHPMFQIAHLEPLGLFLPPSYVATWLSARPGRFERLQRLEALAEGWTWSANFADHYLIVLERLDTT